MEGKEFLAKGTYLWVLIGLIDILELENLCTFFSGRINRKW
jgi:hypothetical protein